mgnify:CR=1 FL=1
MIRGVPPHIKGRLGGVVLDDHALTRGKLGGVELDDLALTRERLGGGKFFSPHHQKGKLG